MLSMRDISRHDINRAQNAYQLDFIKPLISLADANAAQNNLMSQIGAGVPSGNQTGLGQAIGPPTAPGATVALVPAASAPAGAGVANPFGGGSAGSFGVSGIVGQ